MQEMPMKPSLHRFLLGCVAIAGAASALSACAESDEAAAPPGARNTNGQAGSAGSGSIPIDGGKSDNGSGKGCNNSLNAEGCPCASTDAPRHCYPGPAAQAGVGQCKKGTQTCKLSQEGEFKAGVWGPCEGAGAALNCEGAKATCGTASDGCGGQLTCGEPCPECKPGELSFSTAGSYDFDVPVFGTLTVKLWGAGGGGTAYSPADQSSSGGDSSFNGTVIAGGGKDGASGGAGGVASGGTINTPGGPTQGIAGGNCPNGGNGGTQSTVLDACINYMMGSPAGDGENGYAPGGGGMGDVTCQLSWWTYQGWGYYGVGGGAGAYSEMTFAAGSLKAGTKAPVIVGAGGKGSKGTPTSGFPGTGKNPGYYTAGDGAPGQVSISWTCS
jgi:hypothetical protein